MVLFKELSKPVDEVLDKHFIANKPWTIDIDHKFSQPLLEEKLCLSNGGKFKGSTSSKIDFGQLALDGNLATDGSAALKLIFKCDESVCRGLTLQSHAKTQLKSGSRVNNLELEAKYNRKNWQVNALVNPWGTNYALTGIGKVSVLEGTASVGCGVGCERPSALPTLSGMACSYRYPKEAFEVTSFVSLLPYGKDLFGRVTVGMASSNGETDMGARLAYTPAENKVEVAIGAGWSVRSKHGTTKIKAKIDSEAVVSTAIIHKIDDVTSVTVGTSWQTSGKSNEGDLKVGLKLSLSA